MSTSNLLNPQYTFLIKNLIEHYGWVNRPQVFSTTQQVPNGDARQLLSLPAGGPWQVMIRASQYQAPGFIGRPIEQARLVVRTGAEGGGIDQRINAFGSQMLYCPGQSVSVAVEWPPLPSNNTATPWAPLQIAEINVLAWHADAGKNAARFTTVIGLGTTGPGGFVQTIVPPSGSRSFLFCSSAASEIFAAPSYLECYARQSAFDIASWLSADLLAATVDRVALEVPDSTVSMTLGVNNPGVGLTYPTYIDWVIG